jgi:hypothetical protein
MRIHTLLSRRSGAACLVALLGLAVFGSTSAPAWTKGQIARHERYLACKTKITKDPPCNQNWTRYCARQCNALFW